MDDATIAAIATPVGRGGIGIVKISGTRAFQIAGAIFKAGNSRERGHEDGSALHRETSPDTHRLYYGHIVDPGNQQVIDEVLVSKMVSARSYTREDVVEINGHGGPVVLGRILAPALREGARLAEPGEFTRRAYLNGRIDLTQAEAVIDIINAKSLRSLEMAALQIKGDLREEIESLQNTLIQRLVPIEAAIDFPEDLAAGGDQIEGNDRWKTQLLLALDHLIQNHDGGRVYRDGLRIVVVGKPNVGKSSLVNRLLNEDRIIVTAVPGTTSDVIEESVNIHGIGAILNDTAGLRRPNGPIEASGIEKTREYIGKADLLLFLVDAGSGVSAEDVAIYRELEGQALIVVWNKVDLEGEAAAPEVPGTWQDENSVRVSALYNTGLEALRDAIAAACGRLYPVTATDGIVPNLRQTVILKKVRAFVAAAIEGLAADAPPVLVALDLQAGIDALGEIVGEVPREDIIAEVFDQFCIGK